MDAVVNVLQIANLCLAILTATRIPPIMLMRSKKSKYKVQLTLCLPCINQVESVSMAQLQSPLCTLCNLSPECISTHIHHHRFSTPTVAIQRVLQILLATHWIGPHLIGSQEVPMQ